MEIRICIAEQTLTLTKGRDKWEYPVSTALKGVGQEIGSYQTPLGKHVIRAKIGGACPHNAVFVARRWTGEICTPELMAAEPDRDWILSRILWLSGLEPGKNRGGSVDTMRRYVYIHGTAQEDQVGQPVSHGCIRMHNADVIELYDLVEAGISVEVVT